ncbi:hypothetical protein BH10PSE12_BH10PSE12_37160 [soil metagenome]
MARSTWETTIAALALAAGLTAASAPGRPAAPATELKSVAEIIAIEKKMEALYNSPEFPKNPAIIHPYLSPDMTLIDIMKPGRFQGKDTIKHADEVGATFQGKVTFKNLNARANADLGYVEYLQYFVGTDVNGKQFEMNLYTTDIWQKRDGTWKMVHQHVTLPIDQATMVEVMTPKK